MDSPIVVEVTRGGLVESRHRGAIAVTDAHGRLVLAIGDVQSPVYPRSAVKPFLALPLVESGAADKFSLDEAEIALACSSHNGEAIHARTAAAMLRKAGRDPGCLECGVHWPLSEAAARQLARSGKEPTALHNNCSGKHAGFVCWCCATGAPVAGYVDRDHPMQIAGRRAIEDLTGERIEASRIGVDGCSIPTYAQPLQALAQGFARFGSGDGLDKTRAQAAKRIRAAAARHPYMVAGADRFDTDAMMALGERAFTKSGYEGVFCASLPELGLGIALKCADGAQRAGETMLAALIARFLPLDESERQALERYRRRVLRNWNGVAVGEIRLAGPLARP